MRTEKELNSKEFNDNMNPLVKELTRRKIPFTIKRHKRSHDKVKRLIGYYPAGKWHIMIEKTTSVIKGRISFGEYEAYLGLYNEPERFSSAKKLIKDYLLRKQKIKWKKEK